MNSRECAIKVLYEVEVNGAYSDIALKTFLSSANLTPQDSGLATEIVNGVIKNKTRIDYIIQKYSSQKLKKISSWIINILRIGVYQILFLDKVPHSAAVNESVKLAKRYGHSASSGFVNGVLRSVSRNGDVEYPTGKDGLCIYYSHPQWLVDMLCEQYGEEVTAEILKFNNISPAVNIRVNTLKTNAHELTNLLTEKNIIVKNTKYENMLEISKTGDISALDEFKNGLFTMQDIAPYIASLELAPKPGEFIIDVCAAPGGKSTHIAELTNDKANVLACDIHKHRIELIEQNAKRLGINCITTKTLDSTVYCNELLEKADRVLADVPCSGIGVIRRKPDIKWTKTKEDIEKLVQIQSNIVNNCSKYVKPNGTLVYSTCTLNKNENSGVTHIFVQNNPFEIEKEIMLLPHENNSDGFYICIMRKKDSV